jgi:membrane protease subunit (stomatin/prohibitin family)
MGMAAGGIFSGMAQQMFSPLQPAVPTHAAPAPSGRFVTKSAEGETASASGGADDPVATLKKLKEMLDLGLIEQAEFDAKKTEIMNRM